jgi:hypothetical protein
VASLSLGIVAALAAPHSNLAFCRRRFFAVPGG